MMGPGWLLDAFAAVMIAVSAASAGRLAAARLSHRGAEADVDIAHVLMGIAMAGMLVAALTTLPDWAWTAVFAVTSLWFGWRVLAGRRRRDARELANDHYVPHFIHSVAMVYMFLAVQSPAAARDGSAMSGMGGGSGAMVRLPTLALVLVLVLLGYAVWDLDRLGYLGSRGRYRLAEAGAAISGPARSGAAMAAAAGGLPGGSQPASAAGWPGTEGPADPVPAAGPGEIGRPGQLPLAPRLASGCRIAVAITMAYMLIIML
jgi:hypothetical protein